MWEPRRAVSPGKRRGGTSSKYLMVHQGVTVEIVQSGLSYFEQDAKLFFRDRTDALVKGCTEEKMWTSNNNRNQTFPPPLCVRAQPPSHVGLCDPVDCSLPGFSAHGIPQARILEWVAISSSRGSSWSRDQICVSYCVSHIAGGFFTTEPHGRSPTLLTEPKARGLEAESLMLSEVQGL